MLYIRVKNAEQDAFNENKNKINLKTCKNYSDHDDRYTEMVVYTRLIAVFDIKSDVYLHPSGI